jgi:hypothetical protein
MTWLHPLQLDGAELFAVTFATTYIVAVSYLMIEKPFLMLKPTRKNTEITLAKSSSALAQR